MNLATSWLMMPHFVSSDLTNFGAQLMGCNSLKWFCSLSQNITDFCPLLINRSCETWKNKQQSCFSSTTIFFPFFVFDCNYRTLLATPYASTRFINVILRMVTSTSQSSTTLWSITDMEVKWVIFVGTTMVFTL